MHCVLAARMKRIRGNKHVTDGSVNGNVDHVAKGAGPIDSPPALPLAELGDDEKPKVCHGRGGSQEARVSLDGRLSKGMCFSLNVLAL